MQFSYIIFGLRRAFARHQCYKYFLRPFVACISEFAESSHSINSERLIGYYMGGFNRRSVGQSQFLQIPAGKMLLELHGTTKQDTSSTSSYITSLNRNTSEIPTLITKVCKFQDVHPKSAQLFYLYWHNEKWAQLPLNPLSEKALLQLRPRINIHHSTVHHLTATKTGTHCSFHLSSYRNRSI